MLPKKYRLTKRGSFNYVYRRGGGFGAGPLALTYVKGGRGVKIGVSVPNKVGKAVARNKVKRRIRACLYALKDNLRPAQLIISAKEGAVALSYAGIESAVTRLLKKAGLLICQKESEKYSSNS